MFPVRLGAIAAAMLVAACGGATDPVSPTPGGPNPGTPSTRPQIWRATDLAGTTLPAAAYRFENEPVAPNGTVIQLDSARIQVDAQGRYEHRVWYSEWRSPNPALGLGYTRIIGLSHYDHGTLRVSGSSVELESGWIQNLRVRGWQNGVGRMRLDHGLIPGDPLLNVGYTQVQ